MHTLAQLKSGQLDAVTRLQLVENLSIFPTEIFALANTLEVLDLSNNQLDKLPGNFVCLHKLKVLFLSNNCFTELPRVIADCPDLEMIGFKANQIVSIAENALLKQTRWLILTDNKIERLPDSMGDLYRLQKLALAGNRLTLLPASMANCQRLELASLSANRFSSLPDWLFQLPKLSWLAVAGNALMGDNPIAELTDKQSVDYVKLSDIELGEQIGEGASGIIYRAKWLAQPLCLQGKPLDIAVKLFKGVVTSDGYPRDELSSCLQAGEHHNLIKVIAQIDDSGQLGLVMELIPASFSNLGLPPNLMTCTRDTFAKQTEFSLAIMMDLVMQMSQVMAHLHANGVSHGDLYAHNTMLENGEERGSDNRGSTLLGDFGAASDLLLQRQQREAMESIEVRALGCLLDDMLKQTKQVNERRGCVEPEGLEKLSGLSQVCMQASLSMRPRFTEITAQIQALLGKMQDSINVAI